MRGALLVGQHREHLVHDVLGRDGNDVFGHHAADGLAAVSREVDVHVEVVPREVNGVVDWLDEGWKTDWNPERAVARLEELHKVALRDDADQPPVVNDRKPLNAARESRVSTVLTSSSGATVSTQLIMMSQARTGMPNPPRGASVAFPVSYRTDGVLSLMAGTKAWSHRRWIVFRDSRCNPVLRLRLVIARE